MREYEITETVGDFKMACEIHSAVLASIPTINQAKLSQFGSIARRLSKLLEPIVLSRLSIPDGFTFEIKISKQIRGTPSGRMRLQWDELLETRHFSVYVFIEENTFRHVFSENKSTWIPNLVQSLCSTLVHELVHLQQFASLTKSLIARGYDERKYLDISDKIRDDAYLDRPIEAQAFGVEDATRIFFKIATNEHTPEQILELLKQVRQDIPRAYRARGNSLFAKWPDYIDPHGAFEDNPYMDRSNKRGGSLSEQARRIYLKTFVKTLDRIIAENNV